MSILRKQTVGKVKLIITANQYILRTTEFLTGPATQKKTVILT